MNEERDHSISEIEVSLAVAKAHVALRDALVRLEDNPDFKELFVEGYGGSEIIRVVGYKAALEVTDPRHADCSVAIDAMGHFLEYLRVIKARANQAELAVEQHEDMLEELRNESADDGYVAFEEVGE